MGKYERGDIRLMEISVVNILMREKPLITNTNKWYRHMMAFVKYIKSNYPDLKKAEFIGDSYAEPGDIKIYRAKGKIEFLELKASKTAQGRDTLANISQNAVTNYQLIHSTSAKILSWSGHREKNNFSRNVEILLNRYQYTETTYSFVDGKGKNHTYSKPFSFEDKGSIIKRLAEEGKMEAINIKRLIMGLAKMDKKNYINYIKKFKTNVENLIKFIVCMTEGIHTEKEILKFFDQVSLNEIRSECGKLIVLYANVKNGEIIITKGKSKILELLDKSQNFEFSFPDGTGGEVNTYIISIDKTGGEKKRLIQLVYNWKNIFQGIKTPCINVFLGPDY